MKKQFKKNEIILLFFLFFQPLYIFAAAVSVLEQGVENSAMGNTGAAFYSELSSMFYNPSLLSFSKGSLVQFNCTMNHPQPYNDISFGYVSYKKNIGFSFDLFLSDPNRTMEYVSQSRYYITDKNRIHIINSAIGYHLWKGLSQGFHLKLINNTYNQDYYWAGALNIGHSYIIDPRKHFMLGLTFMNILSLENKLREETYREPLNVKYGISYRYSFNNHRILLACDGNTEFNVYRPYGVGGEYVFRDALFVSAGYDGKSDFSAGLGIKVLQYKLSYAFEKKDKTFNNRFGLNYYFMSSRPRTNTIKTVLNSDVLYEYNKAELKPEAFKILDLLIEKIISCQDQYDIQIKGYSDNIGGKVFNKKLSKERALGVYKYFISKGVVSESLSAEGMGVENPIGDNNSEKGRALNRRVEILMVIKNKVHHYELLPE